MDMGAGKVQATFNGRLFTAILLRAGTHVSAYDYNTRSFYSAAYICQQSSFQALAYLGYVSAYEIQSYPMILQPRQVSNKFSVAFSIIHIGTNMLSSQI